MELDPLLLRLLDLPRVGRHLRPGASVDYSHFFGTEAQCGAGSVHGHIATTDHYHPVSRFGRTAGIRLLQQGERRDHALEILSRDI